VNPSVQIREFCYPADFAGITALWQSIPKGVRLGRSDSAAEIEKKLRRDPDLFLVAESGGVLVGSVIGGYDGRRGLIYHLAVAADFRQHGLGSQLMNEVERRLRARGCLKCYLLVTADNPEAMQFYERRGWQPMDTLRLYGKEFG
jgi:ribosomal protein S18 acetylase RimI-like enzyme